MSNTQKIKADLNVLKNDLTDYGSELVKETSQLGLEIKEELAQKICNTTAKLKDLNNDFKDKTVILLKNADSTIKEKPYHSAGIALLIGAAIGVLLGRKL